MTITKLLHALLHCFIHHQYTAFDKRVACERLVRGPGRISAYLYHRCCSLVAWPTMLLVFWLLEPVIHALEKFFIPAILSSCFLQALHHSVSTTILSSLVTSQLSLKSLLWSRSNWRLPLVKGSQGDLSFLQAGCRSAVLCSLLLGHG